MKWIGRCWCQRILVSGLVVLVSGCETLGFGSAEEQPPAAQVSEPEVAPKAPEVSEPAAARPPKMVIIQSDCPPVDGRNVIGEVEWVSVQPEGIRQKARIDTGAQTTSIGVVASQRFERDGKAWVAFTIKDRQTGELLEIKRPLVRIARIKRHNAEPLQRLVVSLNLAMGDISHNTEVTLADREQFEFPLLIGRNFLDGRAVVDVSKKFLTLEAAAMPQAVQ